MTFPASAFTKVFKIADCDNHLTLHW